MTATFEPRRHDPPDGWPTDVFERLTDALAAAIVARVRRTTETLDLASGQNLVPEMTRDD